MENFMFIGIYISMNFHGYGFISKNKGNDYVIIIPLLESTFHCRYPLSGKVAPNICQSGIKGFSSRQ